MMINYRTCHCGCEMKMLTIRRIKCGYCGQTVDQLKCIKKTGKWFHDECLDEYRNFYTTLFKSRAVLERKDVQAFRDYILTEMIMRHDLRILKLQWSLLIKEKATPLVIRDLLLA